VNAAAKPKAKTPAARDGSVSSSGRAEAPIGIIAGGGTVPFAVAKAVRAAGRDVMMFPLRGFADPAIEELPHHWVHLGAVGALFKTMHNAGCEDIVMVGSVVRPRPWQVRFDLTTLRVLPRLLPLFRGGDDKLLSGVAAIFEENGFHLRGAHEVAPDILMPEGVAGKHRPSASDEEDIRFGFDLLRTMGRFDVGQAAVISELRVLAVEAAEGTAGMLQRVAEMRRNGRLKIAARAGLLVKAPKPEQDRRIDLPTIGPDTIAEAKAAGLLGIAVEAGGTIAADLDALVRAADKAGLFVVGVPAGKKPRG
jgi:DUF1009 family protein